MTTTQKPLSLLLAHSLTPSDQMQMMMLKQEQQQQLGFEGAKPSEAVITLLIRHLPEAIPHDTLSRLFSHYGASSVRPCSAPRYPLPFSFNQNTQLPFFFIHHNSMYFLQIEKLCLFGFQQ